MKSLTIASVLALSLTLAACGKKEEAPVAAPAATEAAPVNAAEPAAEAAPAGAEQPK